MEVEKKTQMIKESILHIYVQDEKKQFVQTFLEKNMSDCFVTFM